MSLENVASSRFSSCLHSSLFLPLRALFILSCQVCQKLAKSSLRASLKHRTAGSQPQSRARSKRPSQRYVHRRSLSPKRRRRLRRNLNRRQGQRYRQSNLKNPNGAFDYVCVYHVLDLRECSQFLISLARLSHGERMSIWQVS